MGPAPLARLPTLDICIYDMSLRMGDALSFEAPHNASCGSFTGLGERKELASYDRPHQRHAGARTLERHNRGRMIDFGARAIHPS